MNFFIKMVEDMKNWLKEKTPECAKKASRRLNFIRNQGKRLTNVQNRIKRRCIKFMKNQNKKQT